MKVTLKKIKICMVNGKICIKGFLFSFGVHLISFKKEKRKKLSTLPLASYSLKKKLHLRIVFL